MNNVPFNHLLKDNFLSDTEYKKIVKIHNSLKFKRNHTDLYYFQQSDDISDLEELNFFRKKLIELFKNISGMDGSLSIFASKYTEGDYLLCHDDMVEDRRYAFTFYLDDCESGDLILYEKDCITESKRVSVKSNRLIIFEVSPISFHEVDFCKEQRRAYTGWYSYEKKICSELKDSEFKKEIISGNLECNELEINIDTPTILTGVEFDVEGEEKVDGPFVNRRLKRIIPTKTVYFKIPGLKILEINFYKIQKGDYILINDRINFIKEIYGIEKIYDLFILKGDEIDINYVKNVDIEFTIRLSNSNLYFLERNDYKIFLERTKSESTLAHFIYTIDG